jgi:uncharacterized phage infection (PIP) family protein YhgE
MNAFKCKLLTTIRCFKTKRVKLNGSGSKTVEISEDLRDLVTSTINSIKEGLKEEKCGVSGTIKFEVSVAKSKEAKTGFKVFVADASGNYTKDNTSKISFEIAGVISESEKADLNNRISQLQRNLGASNSEGGQLRNQIQSLNNTVEKQKAKLSEKDEEIEKLRNQKDQLGKKISDTEIQRDNAVAQFGVLSQRIKNLEDELSKEPRVIVK